MKSNQIESAKKHNGIISFWKFCFCMLIIIFHAHIFTSNSKEALFYQGSIGVEFFFLVSGFLLAKAAFRKNSEENENSKNLGKETFHFIMKKYLFFLPYVIFGGIIGLIIQNIFKDINLMTNATTIWDLLLLRMTGLKTNVVIGQVWYISAMLLAMIVLYPLLRKYKLNFIYLIAPLIVLIGFGWLNHSYTNLREPEIWIGFVYKGVIRAFLELTLGCILYVACQKLKNINFTKSGKIVITIIEIFGFLLPFFTAQFVAKTKGDFIVLAFLALSVLLAFSEKTLEFNLFSNKLFFWLEKFSLPLYICNIAARDFIDFSGFFNSMSYYGKLSIYLVINFVLALICMYLIGYLRKKNFFVNYFKKIMIKTN